MRFSSELIMIAPLGPDLDLAAGFRVLYGSAIADFWSRKIRVLRGLVKANSDWVKVYMIHKTAVVGPKVTLGSDVSIGPYTVIEDEVVIGDGCSIGPRVHINGWTTIGSGTTIHAGAIIGDAPQDYDYNGEKSFCTVGDNCIIREYVTIHRAEGAGKTTSIGNNCMLMAFVHVAHNASIGHNVTLANHTIISGHVTVEDRATLSGYIGVHQFCRIGTLTMVGGYFKPTQDIPPYALVDHGTVYGINSVGLKRAGVSLEARKALKQAYKLFFFSGKLRNDALSEIELEYGTVPEVAHFIEFARASKRGILPANKKR